MVTWWPSRPPLALTSFAQRSYPWTRALPSPEKSPLSETDTPIVIGAAGAGEPPALSDEVPHAESTRANPAAIIDTGLRMLPPFLSKPIKPMGGVEFCAFVPCVEQTIALC